MSRPTTSSTLNHNPTSSHRRKISFADLATTFRNAGPMVAPPSAHPSTQPTLTAAQHQAQQIEEARRRDLARRQSRKPTDRDIPDELADVVLGDGVSRYKKLRDVEKRMDAVMVRKRLDVKDNAQREFARREGVLRVWVSNTAEGQPWQVLEEGAGEDGALLEFGENSQARFRVKIEGRLLADGEEEEDEEEEMVRSPDKRPKMSSFFKSITVDFDRDEALMSNGMAQIEWKKPAKSQQADAESREPEKGFDTLEFERKGDENVNITISLVRDFERERFKLSPVLAEILDSEEEDMLGAVQGIWEYARAMHLQEDDDKRTIVCDEPLQKLFNQDKISFPYLPDLLHAHLRPLPPLQLSYTIHVDKTFLSAPQPTIYDLRVPLPNPTALLTKSHAHSKPHLTTLQTLIRTDDDLALLVQKLNQTNAKRKFYDNLARDPARFVKRWVGSQQRDLEVVLAEASRGGGSGGLGEEGASEEWRRGGEGGLWGGRLARESVGLWLARAGKAH